MYCINSSADSSCVFWGLLKIKLFTDMTIWILESHFSHQIAYAYPDQAKCHQREHLSVVESVILAMLKKSRNPAPPKCTSNNIQDTSWPYPFPRLLKQTRSTHHPSIFLGTSQKSKEFGQTTYGCSILMTSAWSFILKCSLWLVNHSEVEEVHTVYTYYI